MTTKPLFLLGLLLGCQGGNLTLPADGSPGQLRAISGFQQEGRVNSVLPQLVVLQVIDGAGRPVSDVALRFQTDVPAARVVPAEVPTDENGYAAAQVRLGSQEGAQTFEAVLADAAGTDLRRTFTLVALARPPADNGGDEAGNDESPADDDDGDRGGNRDHERERDKDKDGGHGDNQGHGHDDHGDHHDDD
jgi:hypothetical protein